MKSRYTLLLLSLVATFSWWLLSTEQKKQVAKINDPHFIDMFIKNFTLTSTNESGNIQYTLKANRLEHYNDEDNSQIINPIITLPQQETSWIISSRYGEIDDKQSFIKLYDNVTMQQTGLNDTITIETQAITIDILAKTINSKKKVTIHSGALTITSDGLHFDSEQKQLKLLSNVSGVYVPQ